MTVTPTVLLVDVLRRIVQEANLAVDPEEDTLFPALMDAVLEVAPPSAKERLEAADILLRGAARGAIQGVIRKVVNVGEENVDTLRLRVGGGAFLRVWPEKIETPTGDVAYGFNGTFHDGQGDVSFLVDCPHARLVSSSWSLYQETRLCFSWVITVPPTDEPPLQQFADFNDKRVRGTSKREPPFYLAFDASPDQPMYFKTHILAAFADDDPELYSISDVSEDESVLRSMDCPIQHVPKFYAGNGTSLDAKDVRPTLQKMVVFFVSSSPPPWRRRYRARTKRHRY